MPPFRVGRLRSLLAGAAEHLVFTAVGAVVRLAGGKKAAVQVVEFGFFGLKLVL